MKEFRFSVPAVFRFSVFAEDGAEAEKLSCEVTRQLENVTDLKGFFDESGIDNAVDAALIVSSDPGALEVDREDELARCVQALDAWQETIPELTAKGTP